MTTLYLDAECQNAQCRYAECRGAKLEMLYNAFCLFGQMLGIAKAWQSKNIFVSEFFLAIQWKMIGDSTQYWLYHFSTFHKEILSPRTRGHIHITSLNGPNNLEYSLQAFPTNGLYYKQVTIIIYDRNDSGLYYKTRDDRNWRR